jgi:methyl-accepting chemotaxis protein
MRNKLSFRIVLVVSFTLFLFELALGYYGYTLQKKSQEQKLKENIQLAVSLFSGEIRRSIQSPSYTNLSQSLRDLGRHFNVYGVCLFDPQGEILEQQMLQEGFKAHLIDPRNLLATAVTGNTVTRQDIKSKDGLFTLYVAPVWGQAGKLIAGLALEMPAKAEDSLVQSYILPAVAAGLLILLIVAIIVSMVVGFYVMRPLSGIREELAALAKGEADLTYEIQVRTNDEIGEMARWFNAYLKRTRLMVTRIMELSHHLSEQVQGMTHSTSEVSAMSEDVSTTIQQIAKGAEEQATKIAEVNQFIMESQETMKQVEKKSHETSYAVDKATATARAGGKVARGSIEKMGELTGVILQNSELVSRLGVKSREVGRVVEIISGIAEQTNLLSLNAAIEAARAGEQGRGFAVVADEVRSLADGASKATMEITSMVQQIQDETQYVVQSMERSAKEAQRSSEGIGEMGKTLDEIVTVIENVVQYSRSISQMIAEQTQRYAKIANSIQDINAVSEQSAASTEDVSATTEEQTASMEQVNATFRELSDMAVELKSMVEKFKVR